MVFAISVLRIYRAGAVNGGVLTVAVYAFFFPSSSKVDPWSFGDHAHCIEDILHHVDSIC